MKGAVDDLEPTIPNTSFPRSFKSLLVNLRQFFSFSLLLQCHKYWCLGIKAHPCWGHKKQTKQSWLQAHVGKSYFQDMHILCKDSNLQCIIITWLLDLILWKSSFFPACLPCVTPFMSLLFYFDALLHMQCLAAVIGWICKWKDDDTWWHMSQILEISWSRGGLNSNT